MKQATLLIIDTRNNGKTVITLVSDGKSIKESLQTDHTHSQAVLPLIEKLLETHNVSLKDITRIEVPVDAGSYTGRRVGVAIAQTFGMLLSIPVNGKPAAESVDIPYDTNKW